MQSIYINKEDAFAFHFSNSSMKIERKDRVTKEVFYSEVLGCQLKKGKTQFLGTFFAVVVSLFSTELVPRKIFKVHDQLLIETRCALII